MFKPLLRTIPTLTGNFTLACKLDKYRKNSVLNYECGITEAVLMPLQNNLANKHINVSLLYDSYEYDVQLYYKSFSSMFYTDNYDFDKNNLYDIDLSGNKTYENRNKDYEFGCKRNIMNSGYQYMFYAPFYVTDVKSLPDEFILHIEFSEKIYKNIHIKIFDNSDNDMLSNYLSVYLRRYIEKIDERCIFCLPESNQATYFGIDVQFGGFKNCKDNVFGVLYNEQLSLNDFDRVINEGFSRNKLIMRQVVPMSFLFNISDILTRNEYNTFINGKVKISGWYERNGMKYDFYDFDTDYKKLLLNDVNILNPTNSDISNNSNLKLSLHEGLDEQLKYDNTVSITHNRWCLLPTINNNVKYITNSSNVFLDSYGDYYETPIMYQSNSSYLHYDHTTNEIDLSKSFNDVADNDIENIITQTKFKEDELMHETKWYDVYNNKCMINGLLYDINNMTYTETTDSNGDIRSKYKKIDKFNIFAYINVINSDDSIKYCKCSLTEDQPVEINATAYNEHKYGMFLKDIVEYNYRYSNYYESDTLFESAYLTYDDLAYLAYNKETNSYTNSINDDIYVDYSYYYYMSNMYKKINTLDTSSAIIKDAVNTLSSADKLYKGFEIYNNVDTESFIAAVSYFNNSKLSNICYVSINQSNNVKSIADIPHSDVVNQRNSRIAFYNTFADCHDIINIIYNNSYNNSSNTQSSAYTDTHEQILCYHLLHEDYLSYINEYYHHIPKYEGAAFISRGHMERNDVSLNYVYVDNWILEEYVEYINKNVNDEHRINITGMPQELAYVGFINYEQYEKYRKRMYNHTNESYTYVLNVRPVIDATGNNVTRFEMVKTYEKLSSYLKKYFGDDIKKNEQKKKEVITELINNHMLYHYDNVRKVSVEFYNDILKIFNENKNLIGSSTGVSLILYTTNEDIIDNFKLNADSIMFNGVDYKNKSFADIQIPSEPMLIPLTTHVLWSNDSVNETYEILSSNNIRIDEDSKYITHRIYDLDNCNKINTVIDETDLDEFGNIKSYFNSIQQHYEEDPEHFNRFYKRINIPTIESENKMKIFENNGDTYAYYYITLNLYNNIYSFNIDTSNNIDTFNLSNLSLKQIIPYIKDNILNYIVSVLGENIIVQKTDLNILIDKMFDAGNNKVINNYLQSKSHVIRYYNDITPILEKTAFINVYSLLYNNKNNFAHKNDYINNVVYSHDNVPIEYNADKLKYCGIPYVNYDGKVEYANEYERKFYNNNELYLLEPIFEITDNKLYTLENIRKIEERDYVFNNVFIPHMKNFTAINGLNQDEYLFLFNRYKIDYTSYPMKLNMIETDKMYKLKFTFTLI